MSLLDLFRRVPSITAAEAHQVVESAKPDAYTLLDVRQPAEYESGHIPGAHFIPLAELQSRINELDRDKKTIVYCRAGNRSRSGSEILLSAGFRDVLNMEGGILAWRGITASGSPEATMFCVPQSLEAPELLTLAWALETGTLDFLRELEQTSDAETGALLMGLIHDKEAARESLKTCCSGITGISPDRFEECTGPHCEGVMVGCIRVDEATRWAQGKGSAEILEFLASLSASAYDYYLRLVRNTDRDDARAVFAALADRERAHIALEAKALERAL
jgi:rhodanese-related sulfurtransferase